ncbi:ATPase 5, plasma membrane-type-like isoform X2 [Brachypodium distachyon]|uniref:ATPase 5, plasma membrane-type-like isoform X2 n=1 Tax=Brachypodium distachyon TaxID=15368 RepID=UPI000D0D0E6A|nr:ATPase 5, plasma membrane-type-like isoform X2 [Brachypodium distachyon]|eukprot:XP_024312576.1 ATPase 5, plasma membrane-type-like isoform X2 [Brachypodium distachyon]
MASPEDMVAELETAAAEVLRRLGTGENAGGLTGEEAARRLRVHGPNIVLRSHHNKFEGKSLMGTDEDIRAALFLQMSIVNQAVALFAHSDDCCLIRCPGPFVAFTFIFIQMVATHKVIYGDLDFALVRVLVCSGKD